MKYELILLKIIRDNQPLGMHKLDRLFYAKVEFSISWIPIIKELREKNFIKRDSYVLTQEGDKFLKEHLGNV